MPRVTRDDVARLAGTSTAVVSYVINNGPRPVAPATRERVLRAIEHLGYRPDSVAQAMASRRTNLIGMIVPDARQPFFGEMAHAVERYASEQGKLVLIGNSDYVDDREVHYLREFLGMRVAGLILVSQGPSEAAVQEITDRDAQVVFLHQRPETLDALSGAAVHSAVMTDDVGGAELAVRHLLGHGHPYVVCFGGPVRIMAPGDPVVDHIAGWRRAMDAAGIGTEGRLLDVPFDRYGAYRVGLDLLGGKHLAHPEVPPAVFCSTDDQAIGLLRAAQELGVSVPGDVAVAGFDDIPEAELASPPLTTVASDREGMARAAVDLVLGEPKEPAEGPRVKRFPSQLVVRRSCGCG
ncbi:LacI family transcriptional regulator [Mangrovactinospora gilvigrisea]|uniref:LacI family transcriptional regulator n=1 Tax=Mangrovactinospora gilvigrisea TaxID=1428644 RepID=A0A1J7BGK6_9ACTN|nr:LacI family DNA-binding transcriptional regulator [Mangrovactinospora gilvigrisea]OIV37815.1 LacI family transcriptional regulator [Mangrovactinospora gilvigrisea]